MTKTAKFGIAGVVVAVVAGLAVVAAKKNSTKPVDVRTEAVEARDLVASVTASGQIQPRTKVDVSADVTGKIVRLSVKEGDLVKKGQFLLQIDAFPDTTFVGRVVEISNSSVNRTAAASSGDQAIDYEVRVQLTNPPVDTRPDFSATAKIVTATRTRVLSIPIIALTVRENEALPAGDSAVTVGRKPAKEVGKRDVEGVFIVGADNKVTFRPVKVGIAGERHFEVLDGLKAGETIVAGTYQAIRELKDGALIKATKADEKKPASGTKS